MGIRDEVKLLTRSRDWRGRARTPRTAEPWELPTEQRPFPTAWARTPAVGTVRAGLQRGLLKPTTWTVTAPDVEGIDLLDGLRGPVVFVANHASHLDTPLILGSLPHRFARRLAVGAAADYFFNHRWRAVLTALVFNGFPVERDGRGKTASQAPQLLRAGWSLLLFPEGTRSQDGWMTRIRLGSAYLCCRLGVPAVPVAIRGTYAAMPRGRTWPVPGRPRVSVRYGRPVIPMEGESIRDFNKRLADALARLWNEEDLGWYAAQRADVSTAPADPAAAAPAGSWRRSWASSRPSAATQRPRAWTGDA
ncbi:1-acyl-sn-glycerol-3-phosphate acyltransferase [Streptomyces sp. NBC_00243]|uniref:lysophospholipid acyltransferase family protein n=1 Tax=Streptomyces sp. NBC_00243 TaxID=2975688 RepID=UPI002DD95E11|nr:lysophospholipid acyltransferase family protein [Streptomyces sp. NBC_00243]WRZ17359.1 1-acyl-sn-glycerol-3-phosphate acyltransferase [Streptomyces sp. NBC_00243]